MTPEQIELARHALGLHDSQKVSWRNHFVAGEGHSDFEDWVTMVKSGDATRRQKVKIFGGDDIFFLTRAGAEKALRPGEQLGIEDFPR